jgi:predicted 3-demethylubiquinone-9 3-methyltransferase (glyoxalase superfamily)
MQRIGPCLWFDGQAEEAADFYVSVFKDSRIIGTTDYLEGSPAPFHRGTALTVRFALDGVEFVALNGGPEFAFSPAVSFVAGCETQEEVDHLWRRLSDGGEEGQCGWLTDKYGVSWQVVPTAAFEMLGATDRAAAQRVFSAILTMKKIDLAALQRAYDKG